MELGKKTEYYELLKPAQEDFYDVDDFNRNADLIDSALKALADKGISLEEMISSLAQVARTGSYNDLSDKPTSLPANGGNADTVDGRHATDLLRYYDLGSVETDINTVIVSGIYRCINFTNYPNDCGDGQGILVVNNYMMGNSENAGGTMGTDNMWLMQTFYTPHGNGVFYRFIVGKTIFDWLGADTGLFLYALEDKSIKLYVDGGTSIYDKSKVTLVGNNENGNVPVRVGYADALQGYSYDDIMDNAYSDSVDIADMHRTEVIIRSYNTPTNVKGYYYADYVCTSSNAREVIQNAVNNCGAGSTIRLLPGSYDINCFENGNYSTITINKNLTIIGSGMESTVISQTGDSDNGEASSIFTVTDGNVVFKDFRVQDATGEIYNASPVFGSGTVSNVTLENLFFILRNGDGSNSGGIIRAKMSNCRILNCRVFKNADVSSDDYAVGMYSGSQHNIISGILNTGNGYVDISCANQTVADSCVFNGNHRTRRRIGSGDFILI